MIYDDVHIRPFPGFQPVTGSVLLCQGGTYREAEISALDGMLHARAGKGHIRLKAHGQTSRAGVTWIYLDLQGLECHAHIGVMVLGRKRAKASKLKSAA